MANPSGPKKEKKIAITLVGDPKELAKFSEEELLDKFQKNVIRAAVRRMHPGLTDDPDPWYQWSYAFF
jgi:ribosomal protein L13